MNWYILSQQSKETPYKVVVYDNYGKGVHTPEEFVGRTVSAFSPQQAFVIATKTWPRYLLTMLSEYKERGITVNFVIDKEKQAQINMAKQIQEEKEKSAWWNR